MFCPGSVNGLLTHVANGQKYSRSALGFTSDVGEVGNFLDKQRGTLAAALNPKSLPGTYFAISKLRDQSVSSASQVPINKFDQQLPIANMSANGDHEMGDAAAGAEIDAPVKPEKQRLRLVRDP